MAARCRNIAIRATTAAESVAEERAIPSSVCSKGL